MSQINRPSFREDESSQIPALKLLQNMGWTYLEPEEALNLRKNNPQNVLLEDILEKQLKKINKIKYKENLYPFKDTDISNAIHILKTIPFEGLIKTSEKVFDLLTLGKSYPTNIKGHRTSHNLKYIDWAKPKNNAFHVTDEYNVETRHFDERTRRPDIVLFINGIPFVIIECKRPDINDPVESAISQHIRNQKNNEIPHLFVFSQILIALCPNHIKINKNQSRYGTTGTKPAFWYPWKEEESSRNWQTALDQLVNTPLSKEQTAKLFAGRYRYYKEYFSALSTKHRQITDQDIMLYGLCQPKRVLEFTRQFILYDAGIKKVARYQQYFSVQNTVKRIVSAPAKAKRPDGVIWHTQGSGKSLSMVLLAKAIAQEPKIKQPKIILVTDRVNLDEQIYKTFNNCQVQLTKATSGTHLIEILKSAKETVTATTIFKFDSASNTKGLSLPSKDIIILIDEAHRTQYGEASAKMRKVCPNACFIAYTGTPLTKKEKHTLRKFGNLIGKPYTSRDALQDKVIVPLLYEGRIAPQKVNKNLLDRMFERITKDLSEDQKANLKRKYQRNHQLAKTDQRIFMIAMDISCHFSRMWKGTGFKGQLAVHSIATAFKYKQYFDEMDEISTAVIVSQTDDRKDHKDIQEDKTALQKHEHMIKETFGHHKNYEKEMIAKFDSEDDPDILIVVNKLLTGFDVPRNTVLYLDKDITENHNLLQATARVNRIFEKKEFGYVIDYYGNLKRLFSALSHYDKLAENTQNKEFQLSERDELETAFCDITEEINKLPQTYTELIALFSDIQNKKDKTAYENVLFEKEKREEFYEKLSLFGNSLQVALSSEHFITNTPHNKIKKYKEELKFFCQLKNHIQKVFAESVPYRDYEPKIERILNNYVQTEDIKTVVPLINIYDNQFNKELAGKENQSQALMIVHGTKKYISENMTKDPAFYEKLSKLLQNTIDEYRNGRISEQEFLQKARQLKDKALTRTDDDTPIALEGQESAKAFFGILKRLLEQDETPKRDNSFVPHTSKQNTLAQMSIKISEIIKSHSVVDWGRNRDIQNKMKNEIEDYLIAQTNLAGISISYDSMDRLLDETIKTAKSHY